MFDAVPADLTNALNALGWNGLPLWAKVVSAAWGLGVVAYGNVSTFRSLVTATWATIRQSIRLGTAFAGWLRQPSKRSIRQQQDAARDVKEQARLERMENAMLAIHSSLMGPIGTSGDKCGPEIYAAGENSRVPSNGGMCLCGPNDACNLCGGKALKNGKNKRTA